MPLPTSGRIKMSEIATEFSDPAPFKLSDYYKGGTFVEDNIVNTSLPTSGTLNMTDMYGKTDTETRNILCNWTYENDTSFKSGFGVSSPSQQTPSSWGRTSDSGTINANTPTLGAAFRGGTGFVTELKVKLFNNEDVGSNSDGFSLLSSADGSFSSSQAAIVIPFGASGSTGGSATYTISFHSSGYITGVARSGASGGAQPGTASTNFDNSHKWFRMRVNNGQQAKSFTSKGGTMVSQASLNGASLGGASISDPLNATVPTSDTV